MADTYRFVHGEIDVTDRLFPESAGAACTLFCASCRKFQEGWQALKFDARVAEALPWLLLQYGAMSDTCKKWMVEQARLQSLTNRLGFTVTLAKQVAERKGETTCDAYRALVQLEQELFRSRLVGPDTFSQSHLSRRQREWMETARPEAAKQWNLLTNWKLEDLEYA
jgi:hypothetical protein